MLPVLTDLGLHGAVVSVTGGGSGIGVSTAPQLGAVDTRVALVGRREASLKEVAAQIAEVGGGALCVTADLADPPAPDRGRLRGPLRPDRRASEQRGGGAAHAAARLGRGFLR